MRCHPERRILTEETRLPPILMAVSGWTGAGRGHARAQGSAARQIDDDDVKGSRYLLESHAYRRLHAPIINKQKLY